MLKRALISFALPVVLLLGSETGNHAAQSATGPIRSAELKQTNSQSGTLQKMIMATGSVTMKLDFNQPHRINSMAEEPVTASSRNISELRFAAATNSFFPILVFNDLLRGPQPGSIALVPQVRANPLLPIVLAASLNQLVIEKLPSDSAFDLAVRDGKTGFTFFNIEGHQYEYEAKARLLSIQGGRVLISKEFANALGRPADADVTIGRISIGAAMEPIEVQTVVNGEIKSSVMPTVPLPGTQPGPDVIVGDLNGLQQFDNAVGTQVGLAVGTDSCNRGTVDLDWFALPSNDHPVIPQNLYRMSGGGSNNERFEQIGQSSCKHAFTALTQNICGLGCNGVGGTHLGSGCSDPYVASLNSGGMNHSLGSRAWINPFTGFYPGSNPSPNSHTGHVHNDVSHRIIVETSDLSVSQN